MSGISSMFLFEVMVAKVQSLVTSRHMIIKSDFGDVFSLELIDPKTMHIVMPEPLPLPPDPPGKKKKKPKPKKPKKGKKGKVVPPPPEPVIQSGQSVLFSSSPEFLIQCMKKFPLELSLWSKEDHFVFIGSVTIPWDPAFLIYLEKLMNDQIPIPVVIKDEYNIFEEGTAKMMAKVEMQVKLSYLTNKLTTAFRTLSEDLNFRKYLYTGINSKTTSYMCTLKTTDESYEENANKVANKYTIDKPKKKPNKIEFADYKNASAANLTFFKDGDYCCIGHPDKPPESIYKAPETCPDIDFIVDYVRKIIVSCNDNMRRLTPRPTICPKIKATDMDRYCYCKETKWPEGQLAERFKKEAQSGPCPICIDSGKKLPGVRGTTFDIANIRGPCGTPECRIARDIRAYIENLVDEDNKELNLKDVIGPCGSKDCTIAEKIQEFLQHTGAFEHGNTVEALSTQCGCLEIMQNELTKRESCSSNCSYDCEVTGSDPDRCETEGCPFTDQKKVYHIYYFTVEHDFEKNPGANTENTSSGKKPEANTENNSSVFPFCPSTCPSVKDFEKGTCSKSTCSASMPRRNEVPLEYTSKCGTKDCPAKDLCIASPADSNIVINFNEIRNPCRIKSCDVNDRIKEFIAENVEKKEEKQKIKKALGETEEDPCYCDCLCTFKLSKKTTYCPVCGGYECLGDDVRNMPEYAKPHPCPVYHKLYDKKYIKTKSPWPEEEKEETKKDTAVGKGSKASKTTEKATKQEPSKSTADKEVKAKEAAQAKEKKKEVDSKKVSKFTVNVASDPTKSPEKKPKKSYRYPPVPKHMGWNWTAEDIPGLKFRPKWRPGAAHKLLVRRYRELREGIDTIKKKRGQQQRKKKIEVRPTLRVSKKDGEFTVEMEVFKKYSKERLLYQLPYEDKPPLTYTIGRTEEERNQKQKQRDKKLRRENRRKCKLLQSTFRDKCQEICMKAYNQAIGVLPLPNPNDPECPCMTKTESISTIIDSCSCSDAETISSSDTDHDEWVIEFSPPAALWNPKAKHPPVLVERESQYTYLDYKVKVLDKSGNQVPRFFKSPEGKMECSDLGGFWGPGHVWLEINKDGFIGPDERWIPLNFIGPDGMTYSSEDGVFTDATGQTLKIGVDGWIDKDGKWVWYRRRPIRIPKPPTQTTGSPKQAESPVTGAQGKGDAKPKEASPNTSPPGEKKERRKSDDKNVKESKKKGTSKKAKDPVVMSVLVDYQRKRLSRPKMSRQLTEMERKKLAKYREIMGEIRMYDDLQELKPPAKTNRASNTTKNKIMYR